MLYEYGCECGWRGTAMRRLAERDEALACAECGSLAPRIEIPSSAALNPQGGFKSGAMLTNGQFIEGAFGRDYRRRRWRYDG